MISNRSRCVSKLARKSMTVPEIEAFPASLGWSLEKQLDMFARIGAKTTRVIHAASNG